MQNRASLRRRYFFGSEFFNVQFINFLTWLRGFHDKLENLLSFVSPFPKRLRYKECTTKYRALSIRWKIRFVFPEIFSNKCCSIFRNCRKKKNKLAKYSKNFRNIWPGVCVRFDFLSINQLINQSNFIYPRIYRVALKALISSSQLH